MSGTYNRSLFRSIRLYARYSLIFFVSCLLASCTSTPDDTAIRIRWTDGRATGLLISRQLTPGVPSDSLSGLVSVRLAGQETAMLGQFRTLGSDLVFEPLIPLTRGLRYTVRLRSKRLGEILVPALETSDRPALLAIYPTSDSLPENLLKIYLHFSRPMREGQSPKYVTILKNGTDTLPGVFLDLQPELWNPDRTLLTLWLDPGRIKRDLQPNKQLGTPLQTNTSYRLVISPAWPDAQGATLGRATTKLFRAVGRDSLSPDPATWAIRLPKAGSVEPLTVAFGEPLDYSLLTETVQVLDGQGRGIPGKWQPGRQEKSGLFRPGKPWQTGPYRLVIESRLEDLAGNNLNRPFDRDITRKKQSGTGAHPYVERLFRIP